MRRRNVDPGEANDENWGDMQLRSPPTGRGTTRCTTRVDVFAASGTYRTSGDKRLLHDTESGERLGFRWSLYPRHAQALPGRDGRGWPDADGHQALAGALIRTV
jgi:hypothetical protein